MKTEQLHSLYLKCKGISTDTRKTSKNNMYFALKGDNFNGNTFSNQALKEGAKYVIIDEPEYKTIKYDKMVTLAIQAIKEQQVQIEKQQQQIEELPETIEETSQSLLAPTVEEEEEQSSSLMARPTGV